MFEVGSFDKYSKLTEMFLLYLHNDAPDGNLSAFKQI